MGCFLKIWIVLYIILHVTPLWVQGPTWCQSLAASPILGALSWWAFSADAPGGGGKRKMITLTGSSECFHLVVGVLLRSAAVNWKCQTCRLAVASLVCVINWTSQGTPDEEWCPSAMREKLPLCAATNNRWWENITFGKEEKLSWLGCRL